MTLTLGALGFYLFDSATLLYVNELVFVEKNGKWGFACPESGWQISGKALYIPNPLTPNHPLFRAYWTTSSATNEHPEDIEALQKFLNALNPLRYMTLILFLLLPIGLPVVLLWFGTGLTLLILLGFIYCTIFTMLGHIFLQREKLRLSKRAFARLAFDSFACAPFALNLMRKITLRSSLVGNPISFARQLLDTGAFSQLIRALCHCVDEEIEFEDEASPRYAALKDFRNRIGSMAP